MGRKHKAKVTGVELKAVPLVDLTYVDPVFAVAAHPKEPVVGVGLATGHVYVLRYDAEGLASENQQRFLGLTKGQKETPVSLTKHPWWCTLDGALPTGLVTQLWKTRRHKGSCRVLKYDGVTGDHLYTAGSDQVVKLASAATGKVIHKTSVSELVLAMATLSTSQPLVVIGTDNGGFEVLDSRSVESKFSLKLLHEELVNDVVQMSAQLGYHWLSVGATTVVHVDVRKGAVTTLDDQEDETLAVCFPDPSQNDTAVVGMGAGVVTLWKQSKNRFADQLTRVRVGEGLVESVVSTYGDEGTCVWAACDGAIAKVNTRQGKVLETRWGGEEVVGLDIDCEFRLVGGSMEGVRIWGAERESGEDDESSDDIGDSDSDGDSDEDGDGDGGGDSNSEKGDGSGGSDGDSDSSDGDSDSSGSAAPPPKRQKPKPKAPAGPTASQLRNMQKHEHGIRKFEGL